MTRSKLILFALFLSLFGSTIAQDPGDTLRVKVLDYSTDNRDTLVQFPESGSYEKILLRYNMRCTDALVSTGTDRNLGCGEWDYSCNTFVVDSSKIENRPSTHPEYVISAFDDDEFYYTDIPTNDYFRFEQLYYRYHIRFRSGADYYEPHVHGYAMLRR